MGLGKTLQTIALLLSNPPEGRDGSKAYPYKRPTGRGPKAPRCTLIVSPVSVMANWVMEIDKFVNQQTKVLHVAIYQGSHREKELMRVKRHQVDVLVCSYQTLVADFKKYKEYQAAMEENDDDDKTRERARKRAKGDPDMDFIPSPERQQKKTWPGAWIHKMLFHRIVLDEAHIIRNGESQTFEAISNLVAIHKLCLTGTPFVSLMLSIVLVLHQYIVNAILTSYPFYLSPR
jgi:SNF2 family DNA or RNA helicase